MMMGNVNSCREAIIQFAVLGENDQRQAIRAVIDRGYTGFLTLPEGYELNIQAFVGGLVTIKALS